MFKSNISRRDVLRLGKRGSVGARPGRGAGASALGEPKAAIPPAKARSVIRSIWKAA